MRSARCKCRKSQSNIKKNLLFNFRKRVFFFFLKRAADNENQSFKPEWQNHAADCEFLAAAGGETTPACRLTEPVGGWLIQSARRFTLPILIMSFPPRMAVPSQDAPLMMELPSRCTVRSILSGHRCSSSSTQQGPMKPCSERCV